MVTKIEVKFMWNGIKVDGKLHGATYSMGTIYNPEEITIYGKRYRPLPKVEGLNVWNDSDSMTDYFENDRIRVVPGNKHYANIRDAYEKQRVHREKMIAKQMDKRYGTVIVG